LRPRGAALRVAATVVFATACARTPLPFAEREDASQFGPIAPFDAGAGPGEADAGMLQAADLPAACGSDFDTSLTFRVVDDRSPDAPRSGEFSGFLSQVAPGRFSVKLEDRVANFELWRPSGAAIPFVAGERVRVAYRVNPRAQVVGGAPTWALTLSGDDGPRYAARSGRAESTDTLLGTDLRGVRTGCPNRYIGDCIDAQEAVVLLEDANGRITALGSGGRARLNTPEAGPVAVVVHAAVDDRNACASEDAWGLFVALEMER
jgi:hypothetical protein